MINLTFETILLGLTDGFLNIYYDSDKQKPCEALFYLGFLITLFFNTNIP